MALPRSEGGDIAEKAAVNGHFASIDLLMRLLDKLHVSSPFSVISKALRPACRNCMSISSLCQLLGCKKKFSLFSGGACTFGLLSVMKNVILAAA